MAFLSSLQTQLLGFVYRHYLAILLPTIIVGAGVTIHSYARLRHIPGPFWASVSNLPRLGWVMTKRSQHIHMDLHKKYGKLVRIGPNVVSVGDPAAIPEIYTFTGKFAKSDYYKVLTPFSKGRVIPMMFATQDESIHRMLRRPVAGIYSLSNLVGFEQFVDTTIDVFWKQLDDRFVKTGEACDLSVWLQRFAFDVMGEITFSKRLGFLENPEKIGKLMDLIWLHFQYASMAGQIPWIDKFLMKNPIRGLIPIPEHPVLHLAFTEIAARRKLMKESGKSTETFDNPELDRRDFLSRFLEAQDNDPSLPDWTLQAWTLSNVTAGSDTTAITLRTIIYNLLKHPSSLQKLHAELQLASHENRLSNPVTWKQAQKMPYLDACIQEAGRIHPAFGLSLERVVPKEGAVICWERLEAGTVVGVNPWVAHYDEGTFGADVENWRPERWLCDEPTRRKMEKALLTFGAGNRTCIGKNISLLEIYKLVPTLFLNYKVELAVDEWRVESSWFVHQRDIKVLLTKREKLA